MTLDLAGNAMVGLTRDALTALRNALLRDTGPTAAAYLQEAGYAGGGSLFEAFRGWLASRGLGAPESLPVEAFQREATEFFRQAGWGSLTVGSIHDTVATLDSTDWAEATPEQPLEHPFCHLSAGMFADFFGRVADAPLAVMEVECRTAGAPRCRFLLGSTEVLQQVYDGMAAGVGYEDAVAATA
jgi:predicted hydrocarbon binding protein